MPYWLESDTFASDPVWEVMAAGALDLIDRLQAAYCRLKSTAAHLLSDGYLTERMALQECRGRPKVLALLATGVLDQPPLLHRQGDECECLGDSWIAGYSYRIHAFSKRNPTRREYNRNRAQKADLRDARLKALVYARDGGCCRYCRSGQLSPKSGRAKDPRKRIHYDHVDPDQPAGPEGHNMVLSCKRCNEHKGRRLPEEADMVLLPAPTPEQVAAWVARGQALFDLPPDEVPTGSTMPADHQPITAETAPNHEHDQKPARDRITDTITEPEHDQSAAEWPPVRQPADANSANQMTDQRPGGSGLGRVGQPASTAPPPPPLTPWSGQPARSPEYPDIYHRRSRLPAQPAPAPPPAEYIWPAGSVPATPLPGHPQQEGQDHG